MNQIIKTRLVKLSASLIITVLAGTSAWSQAAIMKTRSIGGVTHVKVGEEKEVKGLKIQPLEVVEDSRCPQGAVCFVPGIIVAKVKVALAGDVQEIYIGNSQGKSVLLDADFRNQKVFKYRPAFFKGYSISFNGAKARRSETDKLTQDEYDLDFVISKLKAPGAYQ